VNAGPVAQPGLNDLNRGEPWNLVRRADYSTNDIFEFVPFVTLNGLPIDAGGSRTSRDPLIDLFHVTLRVIFYVAAIQLRRKVKFQKRIVYPVLKFATHTPIVDRSACGLFRIHALEHVLAPEPSWRVLRWVSTP
jgi:hypothetical protein